MKHLDLPPIWLLLFVIVAVALGRLVPFGLFGLPGDVAGVALGLAGLVISALAARRMRARATTVMPHRVPAALVTDGVFRFSRNPIYLADVLILLGVLLWIDAPLALPLVPAYAWVLTRRFIEPEEARLKQAFGPAFDDWASRTRRWL
ncbi:isoprenylcysteine carboxylmethyltransferase family protein [Cereibacter sphaeroides]|uniref:methyltransferase family protein n=1 Tax=Rhodobacterales TaxID=204455 RepID=UPI000BBF3119|nr:MULTISPECIES: isoprenylcysteine carboxylmethyltransferase family protein [Paracoccaceae]MCE6953412.1 isoprenylcysteine carboxylmethyltransferase family protein [Cereibacter sphaeroides]MCE6960393.1 isoprenylcysteine carboxylmethyltransferase family protein [Cereibacter sphaeroides]MCE6969342.1 isoprenylcysteine carboxylmethyltransferase family protein [Cereibacter sphaeroides]MCE6975401.1 isoprenylcysteine carboxylmethyltransferase family protein [Cereibacter sphaeroides]